MAAARRNTLPIPVSALGWMLVILLGALASRATAADDAFWTAHVEPLLRERCGDCHNPLKSKGRLDLSSLQSILRGGESGAALLPGRPDDSNLIRLLAPGADPHMPPKSQLSDEQIGVLRTWVVKLADAAAAAPAIPGGANAASSPNAAVPAPVAPRWIPPTGMPAPEVIDRFLEMDWKSNGIVPSPLADDATYCRRLFLDLLGRVPSALESEQFVRDRRRDKRTRLIAELLAGNEHARHLAEVFDVVLMGRGTADVLQQRRNHAWSSWLERAFLENRPWDAVVRSLIVARAVEPSEQGANWYLYERRGNPQAMAEAVAPVVFGLQIKCAQCHDHMVAREIKQAHYWGMVAAFNRTKGVETPGGACLAESAIGGFVSFANLRKESQPARLTFFNGRAVEEAWPKEGEKEVDAADKYLVPPPAGKEPVKAAAVPRFSRRAALADAVTRDNPLLARAMVNRVWALLMGRGIVHPVDLMDSKHPPDHPELLDWLAADFASHGHDVRRLIHAIVSTRAYQRDSRPPAGKTPAPGSFARALEKPLSAEQLFDSVLVVLGVTPGPDGTIDGKSAADLRLAFVRQFPDLFAPEYNATLQQALFLSNSALFDDLLEPRGRNLTARLMERPEPAGRARAAIRAVLGREATKEEVAEAAGYLSGRPAAGGTQQLVWALLTGAEFQLNH